MYFKFDPVLCRAVSIHDCLSVQTHSITQTPQTFEEIYSQIIAQHIRQILHNHALHHNIIIITFLTVMQLLFVQGEYST